MARAVTDAGKAGLAEICGPSLPSLLRRHHRYPCDAGSAPFPVMREAEEGDDEVGGPGMTEGSREGKGWWSNRTMKIGRSLFTVDVVQ